MESTWSKMMEILEEGEKIPNTLMYQLLMTKQTSTDLHIEHVRIREVVGAIDVLYHGLDVLYHVLYHGLDVLFHDPHIPHPISVQIHEPVMREIW